VPNQFSVLVRNFRREKLYTGINIIGLALGLASCLLLGLFLKSELTYDRHFPDHENIYRVVNEYVLSGDVRKLAITSDALGPMLAEEYPDVIKNFVRVRSNTNEGGIAIRRTDEQDKVYYWENSFFVDPHVFEILPVEVLAGDPQTALKEGDSLAISETVAKRYFGSEDPMGKLLQSDGGTPRRITMVFKDMPPNTHVPFDFLFSNQVAFLKNNDNPTTRRQQLGGPQALTFTYLQMHPSFKPADWERMSEDFYAKYMQQQFQGIELQWHSWLQPLAQTHMLADGLLYDRTPGNAAFLYGCAAVALIILLIACINYMNLATARATRRARATAFRKILGASRLSLAVQFLGEALLFSLVALALAVGIVALVLKFTPMAGLLDNKVGLAVLLDPVLGFGLAGTALGIGLLSGLYPAFYLSSWAPLTALTGKQTVGRGNLRMREFLVLVQFTISAAAIASTLLMIAQMRYVTDQPLGFERDNRLMISLRGAGTIEKIDTIRNELLADSRVRAVAVAQQTPADGDRANMTMVGAEGEDGAMNRLLMNLLPIGENYEKVMGLTITQGRDLSTRLLTDVDNNVLVNEALVKQMGWTNPIGKRVQANGNGRVVGVVQDFNYKSLRFSIEPLVIIQGNNDMSRVNDLNKPFQQRHLILDISPEEVSQTLSHAERVMSEADPKHPFEYRFLDAALDEQYRTELNLTKLIGIFAAISIFIACLGLFGLAAFTTEQRSREIGTRKVLGATAWQIVGLLAQPILVLVLIASVLAGVGAWFWMDGWLEGFAYRAGINPLIFLLSAAVAASVAFATVAAQSWRTANADPVQSLRYV
jgi:putative ABC transport system permease protein